MQATYSGRDFNVLAFPCNQFADGDPNSNSVIEAFAASKSHYGSTCETGLGCPFPMFAKSTVNEPMCSNPGRSTCVGTSEECCSFNNPVFEYLKANVQTSDGQDAVHADIDWNFVKFVVARDGTVVKRFHSHGTNPTNMAPDIEAQLAVNPPPPAGGGTAAGGGTCGNAGASSLSCSRTVCRNMGATSEADCMLGGARSCCEWTPSTGSSGSGGAAAGNAACWDGAYTFDRCCRGSRGDASCWSGRYNYAYCCSATAGGGH